MLALERMVAFCGYFLLSTSFVNWEHRHYRQIFHPWLFPLSSTEHLGYLAYILRFIGGF